MGIFYRAASYRKVRKFLKKKGFVERQGGKHLVAIYPKDTGIIIAIPRHKTLSKGVSEAICKKLVELGYKEDEVLEGIF